MAEFLTDFTAFFTSILTNAGSLITFIMDNPILMFPILVGLVFSVVGLVKRLRG